MGIEDELPKILNKKEFDQIQFGVDYIFKFAYDIDGLVLAVYQKKVK